MTHINVIKLSHIILIRVAHTHTHTQPNNPKKNEAKGKAH